jgi:hypothetical protein
VMPALPARAHACVCVHLQGLGEASRLGLVMTRFVSRRDEQAQISDDKTWARRLVD